MSKYFYLETIYNAAWEIDVYFKRTGPMKSTWVVHFIIMKYFLWSKEGTLVLHNCLVVLQILDTVKPKFFLQGQKIPRNLTWSHTIGVRNPRSAHIFWNHSNLGDDFF